MRYLPGLLLSSAARTNERVRRTLRRLARKVRMTEANSIGGVAMNCGSLSDEDLGTLLQGLKQSNQEFREAVAAVSYEVHKRLVLSKGTMLPHSTLQIKRAGSPTYDVGKVTALKELLSPAEAEALIVEKYTPAKTETVVSGSKARSLLLQYGAESDVGKRIVAARLPESTAFSITEKK
jgi:hypothetical protein